MHVLIVYTHPSEDSFTSHVRESFISGLKEHKHTYENSDLYKMNFKTDMSEEEYLRESNYLTTASLSEDVIAEQEKINRCDVIVFIYPLFWTEAPAKLVGWFDRVWTYGFAYGDRSMKLLKKALCICITGHSITTLKEYGHYDSIKTVMLGDRIFNRAKEKELIILDSMTKYNKEVREANWDKHLDRVFNLTKEL